MSNPSRFSEPRRRALLALGLVLVGGMALAQSRPLDAPRASGQVGERFDGFAVLRDAGASSLRPLVDQVNAERRKLYAERAAADKASVDAVGRIYAAEIVKSAPAGTWFLQENGDWVRK